MANYVHCWLQQQFKNNLDNHDRQKKGFHLVSGHFFDNVTEVA